MFSKPMSAVFESQPSRLLEIDARDSIERLYLFFTIHPLPCVCYRYLLVHKLAQSPLAIAERGSTNPSSD